MNEWYWVILGAALGIMLSLIGLFCIIKQNDNLEAQVAELREEVEEHEQIMRAYEFYNWQASLKMNTEDLEK